jgi:hypothetical protein
MSKILIPTEHIQNHILLIRNQKVLLDADLADLYGVTTRSLNQAVKRNLGRFPTDFIFQLSSEEKTQVITKCDHLVKLKFSKSLPYAFTEHGTIMAASVLNSQRAVEINVFIVRAFIKLREFVANHKELAYKLAELEHRLEAHDDTIRSLVTAIRELMRSPEPKKRPIGFMAKIE